MQVSYGPPAVHGVTQLMAVGDDLAPSPTDQAVRTGTMIAAGAWALGELGGNRPLANLALGGALALFGVMLWTRCQSVAVSAPSPVPPTAAGWWR
jgi:hypothetical protein